MEKKMYNVPSTAVTEVEALNVIMGVTQSNGTDTSLGPDTDTSDAAPQRFPQF